MNEFNNIVKRHVDAHESDIDPQEIWDGILAKQKPKRKKRLIILPVLLGLTLSLASVWWLSQNTTDLLYSEASVTTTAPIHSQKATPSVTTPMDTPHNLINKGDLDKLPFASTISQYAKNPNPIATPSQTLSQTPNQTPNQTLSQTPNQTPNQTLSQTPSQTPSQTLSQTPRQKLTQSSIKTPSNGAWLFAQTNNQNLKNPNTIATQSQTQSPIPIPIHSQPTPTNLQFKNQNLNSLKSQALEQTPTLASTNFILKLDKLLSNKMHFLTNEALPKPAIQNGFSTSPFLSYLTFQSTIGFTMISKSVKGNGAYSDLRQLSEKMLESYSYDLSVKLSVLPEWSIETGLAYQRDFQKFDWTGTLLRNAAGENLILVRDNDPVVLPQNFTEVYYETIDQTIQYYNSYEYIDWPMAVSYSKNIGRWRTSLSAGLAFNVYKNFKGKYLSESELPQNLESLEASVSVSPKYQAGLRVVYPFTHQLGFLASVDYSLRNVKEAAITTRYEGIGLRLGLAYRLR